MKFIDNIFISPVILMIRKNGKKKKNLKRMKKIFLSYFIIYCKLNRWVLYECEILHRCVNQSSNTIMRKLGKIYQMNESAGVKEKGRDIL